MIHFLRPEWLLALIPLALLLWLLRRDEQQQSSWNKYIAPHLAKVLVSTRAQSKKSDLNVITFCWLVAVIALAGPAFSKQDLPVFEANQGRVIVMDMSLSMYATDLAPNRLTQAKFKATDLIKSLKEGETGLVAYAGDAFTISPLTRDMSTLLNLLPTLSPEIMPVRGSDLPAALTQAKSLLTQGGHLKGDIILLTDGVSTNQINQAKSVLGGSQYRLSVLALGSPQGAPIRLPDGQLMRDKSDQIIVPKTDYDALNNIAKDNGGQLFSYRADGGDLQALNKWLAQSQSTKASDLQGETWLDVGPYIALLLLLPALLSFRHALAVFVCLLIFTPPTPAYADSWQHPWQTDDQRAMQAYQQQDYAEAASLFSDPNWQASAHYRNGDYQQALELYQQDNSAKGLYNQGNSLMQLQDYDAAIKRYQKALELDANLTDAKANLELAEQLKQQSEQQDSDQKSSDQQSSDQQSSNQNNSEQQQNKDQSQQNDQSNNNQGQQNSQDQNQGDQNQSDNQQGEQSQAEQQDAQGQDEQNPKQQEQTDQNQQDSQQTQSNQANSSEENDNEAQMSANPDSQSKAHQDDAQQQANSATPEPQAKEQQQRSSQTAQQAAAQQAENADKDNQGDEQAQALTNAIAPEELPPQMQRALGSVIDDPQVLLRNKMQLEYQKRRRQGVTSKDSEQW
ncbi:VWA domain-containing protein [Shewanella sp. Isolate11]|uniref:VWA domain-containing protein n=1 Tax=Shewanella sp. Isolate11 TaxID=2908530 RepID=UPI001EFE1A64|nr:VWA domain-containing protein [Shewanella sp. Isolate11]MCG9696289.1 VWA domain-containing protein [Shewanella sp. Isolate11]